ncbi:MAG TPA: hypothetical protein VEV83_05960 [Parafilimonas sp.]|nr:hypothetical protein [Parafilimonas sp.]
MILQQGFTRQGNARSFSLRSDIIEENVGEKVETKEGKRSEFTIILPGQ